jgi:ankyrin repeat protein
MNENVLNDDYYGSNPFHGSGGAHGSTPAQQAAYAREEVRDAMIEDNDYATEEAQPNHNNNIMDEYYHQHQPQQHQQEINLQDLMYDDANNNDNNNDNMRKHAYNDSRSSFHSSFHSVDENEDPAYLFVLLEEAVPKTAAGTGDTQPPQASHHHQRASDPLEHTWQLIRRWLWSHTELEDRLAAAQVRGQADATSLHLLCKLYNPPHDIVHALVEAAPETVAWIDSHGWLPLHHACANGASPMVMQILIQAYPAGKLQQDNQQRTPLHFLSTRNAFVDSIAAMVANAELLSDTGAAELADRGGMLPMHYACAYGTKPEVLQVLADAYPKSLLATENHGRTPMHLAMVNAHRAASPDTIRFLLQSHYVDVESKETINARDHDRYTPLHLLALGLKGYRAADAEKRGNVAESLGLYLGAEPKATADFLTAIQDLPDWLQDTAVVSKHVRNVLNQKIAKRFPTSILIMDGYMLIVLVVCFAMTTKNNIDLRLDPANTTNHTQVALWILFAAVVYFFWREVVQIASLISLGSFKNWVKDLTNWLDIAMIIMVMYYAALMAQGSASALGDEAFRSGAAVTQGLLWICVIMFFKKTLVDFAVFVGGVFYVVKRLAAFLIAVGVILLAFAQMFFFVYVKTALCERPQGSACTFAHCTFQSSLLKVYTMMMGEINSVTRYSSNLMAQVLFVAYGFLVVILLSNVLIAITTDSYDIIQGDRAAIVFWSNRLDFCAEMDAISYALKKRLACCFGNASPSSPDPDAKESPHEGPNTYLREDTDKEGETDIFRDSWAQVMALFDTNTYDEVDWFETLIYSFFRVACVVFIIPLWLAVGAITAGWLWPPQVREYLLVQKETAVSKAEENRQKLARLKVIQSDLKGFKVDITKELVSDRDEMVRMRNEIEVAQSEVLADLQQVKELIGSLLGE